MDENGTRRSRRLRRDRWRPRDGTHPAVVRRARRWARRWARQILPRILHGAPRPDLGYDLELVLSELVTNAVRHGGGVEEIELRATGTVVHLSVSDHATGVPVLGPKRNRSLEHGRGMVLVQSLAQRWGVRRNRRKMGKVVWLELRTTPS